MKVLFITQFLTTFLYLVFSKKISFLDDLKKDTENEEKFYEDYDEFKERVLEDIEVRYDTLSIYKRDSYQCYMKKKEKLEKGIRLFTIANQFVLDEENLKTVPFYEEIYSKVLDEGILFYTNFSRK